MDGVFASDGPPNGDGGEGDSTGTPWPQRIKGWPTLVIEAGDSQSLEALRMDMEWWFRASNHQVKILLLAKLDRHGRRITLEKWVEIQPAASRPGPRSRPATTLRPDRTQEIIITWAPSLANTPASHAVTRGALQLEFSLLFLRPPGPADGDLIITVPRLQLWASRVWDNVD
ncbi:hypothetical protein B0T25DRAFT_541740 [Lasiosphaeria hispida]|uniref:Uncharacterized protein n=1 Tax=Lasiosphaeria hispida TaxID=260671 RepID=A0AAJ0HH34_9PEZI|nr:hypothetical protein B0T25DRAFT_541740 [Lasiosphaeria hispida]